MSHVVHLPKHGNRAVKLFHRDTMARKAPMAKAVLPEGVPATTLPVDCTGNASVQCPMDGNDTLGDCGPVMCAHVDGIRTYGQGKPGFTEVLADVSKLEAQYEQVSGGDNGTDEDMLVGPSGIWLTGIAGDASQTVVDHLDVDVTDVALTQYCIDQFYAVCMAWSVPDDFLNGFSEASVWPTADTPDPNNGHFTPIADVGGPSATAPNGANVAGFYRLWTWGAWCWVSPAFVASVQPQSFVTFSAIQFDRATGYDSHGRHVSTQAAAWIALGGDPSKANAVVAQFPAIAPAPTPAPAPAPTPPAPVAATEASAIAAVTATLDKQDALVERSVAIAQVTAALQGLTWPAS